MTSGKSRHADPVRTFRKGILPFQHGKSSGAHAKPGMPLRECLVIAGLLLTLHTVFWLLGGHRWWAMTCGYIVAGITFVLLFAPMPSAKGHRLPSPGGVENLKRLLCFPVFWPGLLLLIYVWIQSWNIAWVLTFHFGGLLLQPNDHIEWLPSGMQTLLEYKNPFRYLMIFGTCFLWVCALWVGVQTRRGFMIMINGVAILFCLYALIALYQYYMGYSKILGIWEPHWQTRDRSRPFFGTLINVNHAGALLILGGSVTMSLFFHYLSVARKRMQSGGPWLVYMAMMVLVTFTAVMTLSRAVIAMGVLLTLVFAILLMLDAGMQRRWKAVGATVGILLFCTAAVTWLTWHTLDREEFKQEWQSIFAVIQDPHKDIRTEMNIASMRMLQDHQPFGVGAGGFMYYFPAYQNLFPNTIGFRAERVTDEQGRSRWQRVRLIWDYAHNDWLQYTIELGYVGVGILAAIFLAWAGIALRWIRHLRLHHLALYAGLALLLAQATVEFHLQIGAVHLAFAAVLALAVKWQSMPNFYKY
ncbi:MAG: O-antigen ligase family protein [Verrucomicrobia bacterium]|nr:O-antigen ligase family protein [Verrucomicrobiota bacterium]